MSFNYSSSSPELANAVNYANSMGVICVAAAGNDGEQANVYPAALKSVIDVAATGDNDIRSAFSNYGAPPVWLAAPGEGIMTTYPYGTWAAGWGTSFSAPLVSGTAALMVSTSPDQVRSEVAVEGWRGQDPGGSCPVPRPADFGCADGLRAAGHVSGHAGVAQSDGVEITWRRLIPMLSLDKMSADLAAAETGSGSRNWSSNSTRC